MPRSTRPARAESSPRARSNPASQVIAPQSTPAQRELTELPAAIAGYILFAARRHALPPALIHAMISAESSFDAKVRSPAGAVGLMQLMPRTAAMLDVDNPWDPLQNIVGGAHYLRKLLNQFGGDLQRALAAYNAGPSSVIRHGGVPPYPETQRYIERVLQRYHEAAPMYAAYGGAP